MNSLDSRVWAVWGLAASAPLLLGRNPWLTLEMLLIVSVVRIVCVDDSGAQNTRWLLRIAAIMAGIGVMFNVLTVHAGDLAIATLPRSWPIVGGSLTWNAVVYGLASAITLFGLVLVGITIAGLIRWLDLARALPPALAPIAVMGSVAWTFLPQTAIAWTNIREAMIMRGHRFRGARDFVPIVVPLLASGLERSLTLAEALEARGFGVSTGDRRIRKRSTGNVSLGSLLSGLVLAAFGAYSLATGDGVTGGFATAAGVVALGAFAQTTPAAGHRTTIYRKRPLRRSDWIAMSASSIALVAVLGWSMAHSGGMQFSTYPTMTIPEALPVPMAALVLLLVPALLAPCQSAQQ